MFSVFYAVIAIKHGFQCINILQVPWKVLKTAAFGLGFQHLPRDLANVNAWKTMFDLYIEILWKRGGAISTLSHNILLPVVRFLCLKQEPYFHF